MSALYRYSLSYGINSCSVQTTLSGIFMNVFWWQQSFCDKIDWKSKFLWDFTSPLQICCIYHSKEWAMFKITGPLQICCIYHSKEWVMFKITGPLQICCIYHSKGRVMFKISQRDRWNCTMVQVWTAEKTIDFFSAVHTCTTVQLGGKDWNKHCSSVSAAVPKPRYVIIPLSEISGYENYREECEQIWIQWIV